MTEISHGFTFVELLLAATITSVLFVGVGAQLRGGLTVWRRAHAAVEALQERRVALDRLERDLANAIVYDPRPEAYGATLGLLPEPAFTASSLAWFTVVASAPAQPPAVQAVSYACESVQGTPGLWRMSRSLGDARGGREPRRQRLLPDCERLSLRYAYLSTSESEPLEWREEWDGAAAILPRVVEVSVRLSSGERLTRVYAVPAGVLKPAEASGS